MPVVPVQPHPWSCIGDCQSCKLDRGCEPEPGAVQRYLPRHVPYEVFLCLPSRQAEDASIHHPLQPAGKVLPSDFRSCAGPCAIVLMVAGVAGWLKTLKTTDGDEITSSRPAMRPRCA